MKCPNCGNIVNSEGYCHNCSLYIVDINKKKYQKSFYENQKKIASRIDLEENDKLILNSGQFDIVKKLGRGGFGTVYKIRNEENLEFAIKVLDLWRIKPNEHKSLKQRFVLEYKAGIVNNENIVRSYYTGYIEGNPYIIMELCEDGNLADKLLDYYNEPKFTSLALQILNGLKALHKENLIHRDIKPENIIFKNKTIAKLTDFGITGDLDNRMTQVNWMGSAKEIWGTPLYCAPEQRNRKGAMKKAGPGMDIFSFGVTMFEVISGGQLPFATSEEINKTPLIYEKRVDNGEFKNIKEFRQDISDYWEIILNRSLNPDPQKRYNDVVEIIKIIESGKIYQQNNFIDDIDNKRSDSKGDYILLPIKNNSTSFNLANLLNKKENFLLTIGRFDETIDNKNDISINEFLGRHISRKHATLEFENNNWYIRDGQWDKNGEWVSSKNGSYVNQKPIDHKIGCILKNGDIIKLGETEFIIKRK